MLVYEHESDAQTSRTHIHAYLQKYTKTTENIKKLLRKVLNRQFARSDWAFMTQYKDYETKELKPVDLGIITYMSKGKLSSRYNKGFTAEEISMYVDMWKEAPELYKTKRRYENTDSTSAYQTRLSYTIRETPSEAKKRKNDLIKEMILKVNETGNSTTNHAFHTDDNIVSAIIDVLNENHIIFSRYTIRDYYDTIVSRTNPQSFKDTMMRFLMYKN